MLTSLPTTYQVEQEGKRFRIRAVPIFAETIAPAENGEDFDFNAKWITAAADFANREQARGFFSPIHLVHHGRVAAPVRVGDLQNYTLERAVFDEPVGIGADGLIKTEKRIKLTVFADLLFDDAAALELAASFPHRSVEIYDARIPQFNSLALLGAEEPHFRFPNLRIDAPAISCGRKNTTGAVLRWSKAPLLFERKRMPPEAIPGTVPAVKAEANAAAATDTSVKPVEGTDGMDSMPAYAKAMHAKMDTLCAAVAGNHKALMDALGPVGAGNVPGKAGGLDGVGAGAVSPVSMERTPAFAKLEAENAVLRDALSASKKRLSVSDAVTGLEKEGYAVGEMTRKHFEALAARGDTLETAMSIVRTTAPKLPSLPSETRATTSPADSVDPPEVVKVAPNADSPERRDARDFYAQFQLTKHALPGVTFEKFFGINKRPTYAPQAGK